MASQDEHLVRTTHGPVSGLDRAGLLSFRGLPYAAPPVGDLRFRAPAPVEPWTEVRAAVEFGPVPHQARPSIPLTGNRAAKQSEDCLTLNVITESLEPDSRPVVVHFHSGSYIPGTTSVPPYDGELLARSGEVVYVSVNHRLGAFGWLNFKEFSGPEHTFDTNLALRDQIAALEWVRDNIAAFGGDPANVTILGTSMGATTVISLMCVPSAKGLFARAIAQSPAPFSVTSWDESREWAHAFADFLKVPDDAPEDPDLSGSAQPDPAQPDPTQTDPTETDPVQHDQHEADAGGDAERTSAAPRASVATPADEFEALLSRTARALVAASPEALVAASETLTAYVPKSHPGAFWASPVVDDLLPVHPSEAFALGLAHRVPLLIGTTKNEAAAFANARPAVLPDSSEQIELMFELTDPAARYRVLPAYPGYPSRRARLQVVGDGLFWIPSSLVAAAHSKYAPTFSYRYDFTTPALNLVNLAATHGGEVVPVFGLAETASGRSMAALGGWRDLQSLSNRMQMHWLNFIRAGAPRDDWPQYDATDRATKVFAAADRIISDPGSDRRRAWEN